MAEAGEGEWNEGAFRMAVHRALGSTGAGAGMKGGVHEYNDRPIWLPPNMTREDFDKRLARPSPAIVAGAGGHAPHWANGEALRLSQFRQLHLVPADRSGRYYAETANGGRVIDEKGKPWILDVSRIPAK
jgi:hypothetical protein